jgi:hypothetical protein
MSIPKDITYPTILTQADWRVKKAAKGKVGGEPRGIVPIVQSKIDTGLGAALAEAQTAWNAIEWKRLAMKGYKHDGDDYIAVEKANRAAAAAYMDEGHMMTAITKLKAAKSTADAAGKAMLLSGPANSAAKAISAKLQELLDRFDNVSLDDFDNQIAKLQEASKGQAAIYHKSFTDYSNALTALDSNKTKAGWDKSNILGKAQECRTNLKQALPLGHTDWKPYLVIWESIVTLTDKANQVVGKKTANDKTLITSFIKDARAKLKTVQPV